MRAKRKPNHQSHKATRAARRAARRLRASNAAKLNLKTNNASWPQVAALWQHWRAITLSYFTIITVCAFCGHTTLGTQLSTIPAPAGLDAPPYAFSNPFMAPYTYVGDSELWYVCPHCAPQAKLPSLPALLRRAEFWPTQTPDYILDVIHTSPLDLARLSVLDVTSHFTSRFNGFRHGTLYDRHSGIFPACLAGGCADDAPPPSQHVFTNTPLSATAERLLSANLLSNPIV